MKKITNNVTCILLAAITMIACGKSNTEDPEIEEIPVAVSLSAEGLSVKMSGKDLERTFVITADIEAPKDILISVTTNAAPADATLSTPEIVLKQGTKMASGTIKFKADAFPIGSDEKSIKVTIASEAAIVDPAKREIKYLVKGADKPIVLSKATLSCEVTEAFVAGTDIRVPVKITLEAPAEQYTEFKIAWEAENTIETGTYTSMFPVAIDEGQQEVIFDVIFEAKVFKPGVEGISHLGLRSEGAITDAKNTIKIAVKGVEPNTATLSADGADIVVGETDFEKTITVTLTKDAIQDVVFDVNVEGKEGDFEIVNKTITVRKGSTTGTGVVKFLKKAFPIELMTGTAKVSVSTENTGVVLGTPNKLLFNIKGTGTAPMGTISIEESNIVKVGATDMTVEFTVAISETLQKNATFAITATSDKAGSFTLNTQSVTINQGSLLAKGTITFKAASFRYDTDKASISVSIASEDVIVINSGSSIDFKVSGEALNPNKEDVKYCFENNSAQTIYVKKSGTPVSLFFVSEGRLMGNTKVNTIYPQITGGIEGIDYEFTKAIPIVLNPMKKPAFGYVDFNILPAADGKTLTVELFCDEATIGNNKSIDLHVIYVDWLPTTRSAPKLALEDDRGNYGIAVSKVKVNATENVATYTRKEWVDMYDTQSFDVVRGANTIEITSYSYSDPYYLPYATMLVYADFNNDGDFSDAGEEIVAKKMDGIAIGVANAKQFTATMNVPADAATEFPIRVGAAVISGQNIGEVFNSGYFVNPGDASLLRMTDFKAIVQ